MQDFKYTNYSYLSNADREDAAFDEFISISKDSDFIIANVSEFVDLLYCSRAKGVFKPQTKPKLGLVGTLNNMNVYVSANIKPGQYSVNQLELDKILK